MNDSLGVPIGGRRHYGERAACTRCGADIEWRGRAHGWGDRGGNRACVPYIAKGETVRPKGKHTVRKQAAA